MVHLDFNLPQHAGKARPPRTRPPPPTLIDRPRVSKLAVASAPAAFRVGVWQITSGGPRLPGRRPLPQRTSVAYAPAHACGPNTERENRLTSLRETEGAAGARTYFVAMHDPETYGRSPGSPIEIYRTTRPDNAERDKSS